MVDLHGKTVLITGAARRIGKSLALASAKAGASVIIHHSHSDLEAHQTAEDIKCLGVNAYIIKADFSQPESAVIEIEKHIKDKEELFALVNNAAIFEPIKFNDTTLITWQRHLDINLTCPMLLSQAFTRILGEKKGRIINILDWRASRPGKDHFPYSISKAAFVAMTKSLAVSLAPNITVNAMAFGAILPPADGNLDSKGIIGQVPMKRWAEMEEVIETFLFLLTGPDYITGEIIHIDGGRHLV